MTTVALQSPRLGPLTIEVLDERGRSLSPPRLMSSSQPSLDIPDLPAGELTIVATRPSGEQLTSRVRAVGDRVTASIDLSGRSPHEFLWEATARGLVRARPADAPEESRGLSQQIRSGLLLSDLAGTAGRNLIALGASPILDSSGVGGFDVVRTSGVGDYYYDAAVPIALRGHHTLVAWTWEDGRWRRGPAPRQNLNAGSAYLQLRLWGTDLPIVLGLLDGSGHGPIVVVPPFRSGIDVTFLAEGMQSNASGRRVDNPSAVRTPVALAVPLDDTLADLLSALSAPAMPQASALWDQVSSANWSPADSAHAFLLEKRADPAAATLGALFLTRFAPERVPGAWLRNLDRLAVQVADNACLLAWEAMSKPSDADGEATARRIQNLVRSAQRRPMLYFARTRVMMVQAARLYGPFTRSRQLELASPRRPRPGDFLDVAADAGGLEAFWGSSPTRPGPTSGVFTPRNDDVVVDLVDGTFSVR